MAENGEAIVKHQAKRTVTVAQRVKNGMGQSLCLLLGTAHYMENFFNKILNGIQGTDFLRGCYIVAALFCSSFYKSFFKLDFYLKETQVHVKE